MAGSDISPDTGGREGLPGRPALGIDLLLDAGIGHARRQRRIDIERRDGGRRGDLVRRGGPDGTRVEQPCAVDARTR
jgi:hypothetical protein